MNMKMKKNIKNELFKINPVSQVIYETENQVKGILCKIPCFLWYKYLTDSVKYEVKMILQNKYYSKHNEGYTHYVKRRDEVNNK